MEFKPMLPDKRTVVERLYDEGVEFNTGRTVAAST